MSYSKQLKKQQRKQTLAKELQNVRSGSAYGGSKSSSSKGLVGFVLLCGFIANTMSANADAATHVPSSAHLHSFEAQNQTFTLVTGPAKKVTL